MEIKIVYLCMLVLISAIAVSYAIHQDLPARSSDEYNHSRRHDFLSLNVGGHDKAFPCPNASAIAPCVCSTDLEGRLYLDCSRITSNQELEGVFLNFFPVKEFHEFKIVSNDFITELGDDVFQDVSFEHIYIQYTNINSVSQSALTSSETRLDWVLISYGNLTQDTFPLDSLWKYTNMTTLFLEHQAGITSVPLMTSDTLPEISFYGCSISTITPGE